jgi:hypothetical protein
MGSSAEPVPDFSDTRTRKTTLRGCIEHLRQMALARGAQEVSLGLVDVVSHPHHPHPALNYAAPRRNTAVIPMAAVAKGLDHLASLGRGRLFLLGDALYPPMFAEMLAGAGLRIAAQRRVFVRACAATSAENTGSLRAATGAIWDAARTGGEFTVVVGGGEPAPGAAPCPPGPATQVDLQAMGPQGPQVFVRWSLVGTTANLAALGWKRDMVADLPRALGSALAGLPPGPERICFALATDGPLADALGQCGFVELAHLVWYADAPMAERFETDDDPLGQPVLSDA